MLLKMLYRAYRGFFRFRYWRKKHVTPAGLMVMTAFCVSGLCVSSVLRTNGYQLFVLLSGMICVSVFFSFFPLKLKFGIRRHLGHYAVCKKEWTYEVEITNFTSRTQKGLVFFDETVDPRPDFETLMRTREPGEEKRNAWDRKVLYYRWQWLIYQRMKIELTPIQLPDIKPGETVKIKIRKNPISRGILAFSGVTIARPDVLGLFNRLYRLDLNDKILVLPEMTRVKPVSLASKRQYHPGGVNLASSIGNSDEFMALRQYRPGDPMRNIHWRSFAKTSQLVIKEFEDEHFTRHALILDTFSKPEYHDGFEKAVSLAASYVTLLQGPESILDLLFAGHKIFSFSTGRGLGQISKLLEVLACVQPNTDGKVSSLLPALSNHLKRVSGSICIFQDWQKGHTDIYQLFQRARIDAYFIVVSRQVETMEKTIMKAVGQTNRIEVVPL